MARVSGTGPRGSRIPLETGAQGIHAESVPWEGGLYMDTRVSFRFTVSVLPEFLVNDVFGVG